MEGMVPVRLLTITVSSVRLLWLQTDGRDPVKLLPPKSRYVM